jgi:hypothetical protein
MLEEGEYGWEAYVVAIVAAQSTSGGFHQASPKTEIAVCTTCQKKVISRCVTWTLTFLHSVGMDIAWLAA